MQSCDALGVASIVQVACVMRNSATVFSQRMAGELRSFSRDRRGSIAIIFGLTLVPVLTMIGVAVDYQRAQRVKTMLQSSLDAAILAASTVEDDRIAVATRYFDGNFKSKNAQRSPARFVIDAKGVMTGTATALVPTTIAGLVGVNTLAVSATASSTEFATALTRLPKGDCFAALDPSVVRDFDWRDSRSLAKLQDIIAAAGAAAEACRGAPGSRHVDAGPGSGPGSEGGGGIDRAQREMQDELERNLRQIERQLR